MEAIIAPPEIHSRLDPALTETDCQKRAQGLIERIIRFAELLRKNRIQVHTANELDAIASLQYVDMQSPFEFYMSLKATLLHSYRHFPVFDQLFAQFWKEGIIPERSGIPSESPDEAQESAIGHSKAERDGDGQSKQDSQDIGNLYGEKSIATYSRLDTLREKDFADFQPAELEALDELFKTLRINVREKQGRRFRPGHKAKTIDLPKSISQSRQTGGDIVKIFTKEKKAKQAKMVILADVSGSMDIYSTFLIKFIYELQKCVRHTETFVFGTRLKRVTDLISYRSISTALAILSQNIPFWSGGTDIGGSFHEFNDLYGEKLRKRSRILVIMSDGWDIGDIETLKKQMAVFKRGFKKTIWLNPNLKYASYEPLCMGMAAAISYTDYFLPCHNLKTLEKFIEIVKKI